MAYIGTSPSNGVRRRFVYEATANQTSFSGNDESGITLTYVDSLYLDVYQNGVKLKAGDDYAATTGTTVVLAVGATADDVVEMVSFDVFSVNDSVSASAGGGFAGNISSPIVTGSTSLRTPLIEFTDGDDAIAIADGGVVTLLSTAVAKSEGGAVTTNIAQGVCKAWNKFQGDGTIALEDSFNVGTLTDVGTGEYRSAYTSAMNSDNYAHSISSAFFEGVSSDTATTTALINYFTSNRTALADVKEVAMLIFGDLA